MCKLFIGADPALWENETKSFRLEGMVTSVRLEARFWDTLGEIAVRDNMTVPQMLQRLYHEALDEGHDIGNFASFLRVCCLRYISLQLDQLIPRDQSIPIGGLLAEDILQKEKELPKPVANWDNSARIWQRN